MLSAAALIMKLCLGDRVFFRVFLFFACSFDMSDYMTNDLLSYLALCCAQHVLLSLVLLAKHICRIRQFF